MPPQTGTLLAKAGLGADRAPRALAALGLMIGVYIVLGAMGLDPLPSLVSRLSGDAAASVVVATGARDPGTGSVTPRTVPRREIERNSRATVATSSGRTAPRVRRQGSTPVRAIAQPLPRGAVPSPESTAEPPVASKPNSPEPQAPAPSPAAPSPPTVVSPPSTLPDPPAVPLPDPTTLVDPGAVPPPVTLPVEVAVPLPNLPALP